MECIPCRFVLPIESDADINLQTNRRTAVDFHYHSHTHAAGNEEPQNNIWYQEYTKVYTKYKKSSQSYKKLKRKFEKAKQLMKEKVESLEQGYKAKLQQQRKLYLLQLQLNHQQITKMEKHKQRIKKEWRAQVAENQKLRFHISRERRKISQSKGNLQQFKIQSQNKQQEYEQEINELKQNIQDVVQKLKESKHRQQLKCIKYEKRMMVAEKAKNPTGSRYSFPFNKSVFATRFSFPDTSECSDSSADSANSKIVLRHETSASVDIPALNFMKVLPMPSSHSLNEITNLKSPPVSPFLTASPNPKAKPDIYLDKLRESATCSPVYSAGVDPPPIPDFGIALNVPIEGGQRNEGHALCKLTSTPNTDDESFFEDSSSDGDDKKRAKVVRRKSDSYLFEEIYSRASSADKPQLKALQLSNVRLQFKNVSLKNRCARLERQLRVSDTR